MASNYPPGVTGNEPQITGAIEFDPHAPFWTGEDPDSLDHFAVFSHDREDEWWGGFETIDTAQELADTLNQQWSLRDPQPDAKTGQCRVCGDFHEPPGDAG